MNRYITPELEVVKFETEDIVTASGILNDGGEGGGTGNIEFLDPVN